MKNCKQQPVLPLGEIQCAACKKCSSISSHGWCCFYGFWIDGKEFQQLKNPYENDYEQIKGRYTGLPAADSRSQIELVDLQTYKNRRTICNNCFDTSKCLIRPCMRAEKIIQLAVKCSLNRW